MYLIVGFVVGIAIGYYPINHPHVCGTLNKLNPVGYVNSNTGLRQLTALCHRHVFYIRT